MKFTKKQIRNLKRLNISGKGGKDRQIAEALGHTRESAKFHDGIDDKGNKWEYKKQTGIQFFDPYKFSQMTEEEKEIPILFFNHKEGEIVSIYMATYAQVIKTMGYTKKGLALLNELFKRPEFANRMTQPKAQLNKKEIASFKKVWELEKKKKKVLDKSPPTR
tara:strand:+ start:141 stop:629 length:489 start_codon:yes stop_codon:yes gene_type:complete